MNYTLLERGFRCEPGHLPWVNFQLNMLLRLFALLVKWDCVQPDALGAFLETDLLLPVPSRRMLLF